jgi:hypothetical protein
MSLESLLRHAQRFGQLHLGDVVRLAQGGNVLA